jgi:hypothetical protein
METMNISCEVCGKNVAIERLDSDDGKTVVLRGPEGWSYFVASEDGGMRVDLNDSKPTSPTFYVFTCSDACRAKCWTPLEKARA